MSEEEVQLMDEIRNELNSVIDSQKHDVCSICNHIIDVNDMTVYGKSGTSGFICKKRKTFRMEYDFSSIDLGFPKNPVIGQIHKHDGFCVELENDMGRKYKKEFSLEFVFIGGSQWVQMQGLEAIKIKIGGECE